MRVRELWRRLLSFCYKHEVHYLYCCDVEQTLQTAPPSVEGLVEYVVDSTNLEEMKAVISPFPTITETYVKRGDIALMAADGSQWVFRSTMILGPRDHTVTGFPLHLSADDAYMECAETIPSWRGKGVAPGMLNITMRTLLERGYRRSFLTITTNNTASCRAVEKGGGKQIGTISSLRLLGRWKATYTPLTDEEQYTTVVS